MAKASNGCGDGTYLMRDSGLGLLGSEKETSSSQPVSLTAVNVTSSTMNVPTSPANQLLSAVDVMTGNLRSVSVRKYNVTYVGQTLLDKRYTQPQFWKCFLPWLVPEVRRRPKPQRVTLQVQAAGIYTLQGFSTGTENMLFEHKLQHLSKFSRIHADTKCFVYLTKATAENYLCHVYQAPDEHMVRHGAPFMFCCEFCCAMFKNINQVTSRYFLCKKPSLD